MVQLENSLYIVMYYIYLSDLILKRHYGFYCWHPWKPGGQIGGTGNCSTETFASGFGQGEIGSGGNSIG